MFKVLMRKQENKEEDNMNKYLVEFGFGENFTAVEEWDTCEAIEAGTAEEAAKTAAATDGLENALFRVFNLVVNEFGTLEKSGEPVYFGF